MLARFSIYYKFDTFSYDANNASGSDTRVAFPEGLTILAGDMYQREINASDPKSTAGVYQCQRSSGDSPYSHDIRDFQKSGTNCDASLRATIDFPSCWDGVEDNSDLVSPAFFVVSVPELIRIVSRRLSNLGCLPRISSSCFHAYGSRILLASPAFPLRSFPTGQLGSFFR